MTTQSTPPPPPESAPQPTSGGGSQGFLGRLVSNKVVLGIGGVAIVAVIAIVVVVFATGIIGDPGRTAPQDFILDSSSSVTIVDVAAILASPEIPAQLASFRSLGLPVRNPDDPEEWKDAWRIKWEDGFPGVSSAVDLDNITSAVFQEDADGKALGWVFFGVFAFADIRDSLEDAGRESDSYRDFEVWDNNVALLEDRGALLIGPFVQDLLKALDTEKGFVDDSSPLKQTLDKSGEGLVISGATSCNSSFFSASLSGCDAIVEVVRSGDAANTALSGIYVFSSETRAESGLDDIEEAVENQDTYDADLQKIEANGEFVSYEADIIGGFVGGGTGEGGKPQDFVLEDAPFVTVVNVATILEQEFPEGIPSRLTKGISVFELPDLHKVSLEEPDEWKDEWRAVYANSMPGWLGESIALDDVTYIMAHGTSGTVANGQFGLVISGNFVFDDIREALEEFYEPSEYRGFDTWISKGTRDHGVALLEDRGVILFAQGFVQDFLKALDKGEGFADESSEMKQALDEAGDGLVIYGSKVCDDIAVIIRFRFLQNCEAVAETLRGGESYSNQITGVYVFRRDRHAENGQDHIQDSIEDSTTVDMDLNSIKIEGTAVVYEGILHEQPVAPTPTPAPPPTEAPRDNKYLVALAYVECGWNNGDSWVIERVQRHGSIDDAVEIIAAENSLSDLLDARLRECGY